MLLKALAYLLTLSCLIPLNSQGQVRPFMSLNFPPPSEQERKQEELQKRMDDYVRKITGGANNSKQVLNKNSQRYLECLQSRVYARNLGSLNDLANLCPGNMFSDHQLIKKLGLPTPG